MDQHKNELDAKILYPRLLSPNRYLLSKYTRVLSCVLYSATQIFHRRLELPMSIFKLLVLPHLRASPLSIFPIFVNGDLVFPDSQTYASSLTPLLLSHPTLIQQDSLSALLSKYLLKSDNLLSLQLRLHWSKLPSPLPWQMATTPSLICLDTFLLSPLVYSPLSSQRDPPNTEFRSCHSSAQNCLAHAHLKAFGTVVPSTRTSLPPESFTACSLVPFFRYLLGEPFMTSLCRTEPSPVP